MKIKKYILILIILIILVNITSINATTDNNHTLESTDENTIEITQNTSENSQDLLSQKNNITSNEILTQNNDEEKLSQFYPYNTQITLTVNDTSNFEKTGNITINMHISFIPVYNDGEFPTYNITIYENSTKIKTLNVGELNLTDPGTSRYYYTADVLFNYTLHPNSFLTTHLFTYSNTLYFKNLETIALINLNTTQININNRYSSNSSWNNSVKSIQKALELAENNDIIYLNNIDLIQDTGETIQINKNITIAGNNATFTLKENQTLFEIPVNTQVIFINLTFTGNNNYIITNKGKLQLINCTFKDNSMGLIENIGELEINECNFQELNQFYQTSTTNTYGLITNTGNLKINNTLFNNEKLLPYNIPIDTATLKGIIYNSATLTLNNVNFTDINYRLIYNEGKLILNNALFENISSTGSLLLHEDSINQQLNTQYIYNSYTILGTIYTVSKTMNGGAIYNTNELIIKNTTFKKITGTDGGAIYNTNQLNITNSTFQSTTGSNGGAIYNNNQSKIIKSIFNSGSIYNNNELIIENSMLTTSSISNKMECSINNSTLTKSSINNNGNIDINNTIIKDYDGLVLYNNGIMTITNSQITNNHGLWDGNVILNTENGKLILNKSIINNNTVQRGTNQNWAMYWGLIKNNGNMEITGCIFDNNRPSDWNALFGGEGSFNLFNTGTITIMYSYLLNTKIYTGSTHDPTSFLYNAGSATLNYNFYCLSPGSIIRNANTNYYFIPAFEDDYYPIKLNENTNITLTLALTNGANTIEFNDWDKLLIPGLNATITTIDENGEYINITTLLKDKYTFNFNYTNTKAIYTLYANILNYKNTAIVDIGKEFPEMTVTYNNITYNDGNITFHIKVTGNLTVQPTGNVTFTYNNQKYTVNLTDGECNYTITETLDPANYTMRIDYNGDDEYFKIIKQYYTFSVNKIPTNITVTAKDIKIGEKGEITITITPNEAKLIGYLYLIKDNIKREFGADTSGTRTLNIKDCGVGIWNVSVIFEGDDYYLGGTATTQFTVSKYETEISISCEDVKAGKTNTTINITINPGDVRGEATLIINGVNQTIYLNDTVTPVTVEGLKEGTYEVSVYYPGDSKYASSTTSSTFSVNRITTHLTAEIHYNENLTGYILINTSYINATGEVGIYINNDLTVMNLTNGSVNITQKFKRGTNYIYIKYNGDDTYSISTWNTTTYIEGKAILTLETTALEEQKTGYIRINLTDTDSNPYEYTNITVEFNNQTSTYLTNENGTVIIPVKLNTGTYTIKATYKNATLEKNITVKTLTTLTVNIPDINVADDLIAYATLTYDNNTITANITLEINSNYYKIVLTDGAGSRNLGEFTAGTYTYTATYTGTNNLALASVNGTFQVIKNNYKITGNTNIVQYYGATKTYKIRLLNNNVPVKNEIITIKINKNTVKVKTDNNGYATLKLSLKAGKYTITSSYQNVKVSNKITVKKTLITKNKKVKKGKTLTYTAKLLNKNGKKLKGKKITFKINGKKYKAKTNKKGIAKIKIKNLKVGKYKIKTTYKKLKNTNKITVKK